MFTPGSATCAEVVTSNEKSKRAYMRIFELRVQNNNNNKCLYDTFLVTQGRLTGKEQITAQNHKNKTVLNL